MQLMGSGAFRRTRADTSRCRMELTVIAWKPTTLLPESATYVRASSLFWLANARVQSQALRAGSPQSKSSTLCEAVRGTMDVPSPAVSGIGPGLAPLGGQPCHGLLARLLILFVEHLLDRVPPLLIG